MLTWRVFAEPVAYTFEFGPLHFLTICNAYLSLLRIIRENLAHDKSNNHKLNNALNRSVNIMYVCMYVASPSEPVHCTLQMHIARNTGFTKSESNKLKLRDKLCTVIHEIF